MPVVRIEPVTQDIDQYTDALVRELQADESQGPDDAPLIIEEHVPRSDNLHVTVLWNRWRDLEPQTRGQVILNAYERARGLEDARRVTIAMGLTRTEADHLGITLPIQQQG